MNVRATTFWGVSLVVGISFGASGCFIQGLSQETVEQTIQAQAVQVASDPCQAPVLDTYSSKVHPYLLNNCATCHGASTNPKFAVSDPSESYMIASGYVDLLNPSNSILYARSKDGHCGLSNCKQTGAELLAGIQEWASADAVASSCTSGGSSSGGTSPSPSSSPSVMPSASPSPKPSASPSPSPSPSSTVSPSPTPTPCSVTQKQNAYSQTAWPVLKTSCASCHGTGGVQVQFANTVLSTAYAAAILKVNTQSVTTSQLYIFSANGHCGTAACKSTATQSMLGGKLGLWFPAETTTNCDALTTPH